MTIGFRSATFAAVLTAASLLAGGPAYAAKTSSDGGRISTAAANPCGLYRDGSAAMYKNCTTANERIFVTYLFSSNQYYCVTPGSVAFLGSWGNVFRAYNRGTC